MGYTTYFSGEWSVVPPLQEKHRVYLTKFAQTRRMARDEALTAELPDEERRAVGLPVGVDGAYYTGSTEPFGQDYDKGILDWNSAPGGMMRGHAVNRRALTDEERLYIHSTGEFAYSTDKIGDPCDREGPHGEHDCEYVITRLPKIERQPGLWCQWVPNEDGSMIEWDEGEKFYAYIEWIAYLLKHFLVPWGYQLDGTIEWSGEEYDDRGAIKCEPVEGGATKLTILAPGELVETNHAIIG